MLTVPSAIQTLFKTDSVRKNFRVHFPNGENADLTNSDIVSGSVKFTESVCSKDVLQFGLAEASRIEFECVNVQNIYGMTIECGIEVDTSSLSAAQITAIQGNPGDGTLVLENDSDIGYGFYRVPYGVFTVTSCPRSAGAMWRRRVEAYGDSLTNLKMSRIEKKVLSSIVSLEKMTINVPLLIAQETNSISGLSLAESSLTSGTSGTSAINTSLGVWQYNGDTYSVGVIAPANAFYRFYLDEIGLFRFTCTANTTQIDAVYEFVRGLNIPEKLLGSLRGVIEPSLRGLPHQGVGGGVYFDDPTDSGYIYYQPDVSGMFTINYMRSSIDVVVNKNGSVLQTYTITPYTSNEEAKKYILTDSVTPLLNITINKTSDVSSGTGYSFVNSLELGSLSNGYAELKAQFERCSRQNEIQYITLSKSSPISVNTTEYSDLWWDEYDIAPIGSATITYFDVDQNAEQTIVYDFGNGASEYDMTDNYLLKNLAVSVNDLTNQTVEEFVTGLLDTYFIPNISDIAFTPVQLDALGLPYLEAGDYLEIDDGNSGTVGTYIMNRTISGEQFLEDSIESQGGEIIGNARSA